MSGIPRYDQELIDDDVKMSDDEMPSSRDPHRIAKSIMENMIYETKKLGVSYPEAIGNWDQGLNAEEHIKNCPPCQKDITKYQKGLDK